MLCGVSQLKITISFHFIAAFNFYKGREIKERNSDHSILKVIISMREREKKKLNDSMEKKKKVGGILNSSI